MAPAMTSFLLSSAAMTDWINEHVVGLIPAAGRGTRLGHTPCSKEVFPLVDAAAADEGRMRVMADCLLEAFTTAGIRQAYFIIREGKWDIPAYFRDGGRHGLDIGYLMMGLPWGTPFTLDQAYPFVRGKTVATGFPDMRFTPIDVFGPMLRRLQRGGADIVLGAMPQPDPASWDMVAFDDDGRVLRIDIKRPDTDLTDCWFAAVWSPRFTEFMHRYLTTLVAGNDMEPRAEVYLGNVVQAAMQAGLAVVCEPFPDGCVTDLGTIPTLCTPAR